MSSIEERLVLDIAAVTKGVVVAERDLLDAQRAVDERVDSRRRRDHRRTVAVVAAAAVVVAGVGIGAFQAFGGEEQEITPAGSDQSVDIYEDFLKGEAPTPENLNGFWRADNQNIMVWFKEDGTVQFSHQGAVVSNPTTRGTYTIDGDTIAVTTTHRGCSTLDEYTMRAALAEPGLVHIVLNDSIFGTCNFVATRISLENVLPTDGNLADARGSDAKGWRPVAERNTLHGVWMAEGGGYLLEVAKDGTYYVADSSVEVVDKGYWTFSDSALELLSRAQSPRCDEGDMFTLGELEYIEDPAAWVRGTVDQNDCGGGWTPAAWLRISDASSR